MSLEILGDLELLLVLWDMAEDAELADVVEWRILLWGVLVVAI
jgi:hypothetical protein